MTTIDTIEETVTPLPDAMSRTNDPANYRSKADIYFNALEKVTVGELIALISAFNAFGSEANMLASEVNTMHANVTAAQAVVLAAANYVGEWRDQTGDASIPMAVSDSGDFWMLNTADADITSIEPGVSAKWTQLFARPSILREERTTNITIDIDDHQALIEYTSGGFAVAFAPVSTLYNGWHTTISNASSDPISLDPHSTETIDGLTSFKIYPGEVRLAYCDGSALYSKVLKGFEYQIDSTEEFTKPPGYTAFSGLAWSGAASGQRSGNTNYAFGGGGGGCFPFKISASKFGTAEMITIGAGGDPVTTTGKNAGGDTSIGSLLTVYGAPGGTQRYGGSIFPVGIYNHNDTMNPVGFEASNGADSVVCTSLYGGAGSSTSSENKASDNSIYGGAAGGTVLSSGAAHDGGSSLYGGDGGDASDTGNGNDGQAPGGGGGGTRTGTQSGAGGNGRVIIRGEI